MTLRADARSPSIGKLPQWLLEALWVAILVSLLGLAALIDSSLERKPIRSLAEQHGLPSHGLMVALANEVLSPSYVPVADEDPPKEKIQYQSQITSLPLVSPRVAPAELKRGAHYPEGEELHVTPESDLEVQAEPIEEAPPGSEAAPGADEAKGQMP